MLAFHTTRPPKGFPHPAVCAGDIGDRCSETWVTLVRMNFEREFASCHGKITAVVGKMKMALTRSFKETVQAHVRKDPKFAEALFKEAIDLMLNGDVDTGKEILRDYINATISFQKLAKRTALKPESLMRMFGPGGNPTTKNLFSVVKQLQHNTGVKLQLAR